MWKCDKKVGVFLKIPNNKTDNHKKVKTKSQKRSVIFSCQYLQVHFKNNIFAKYVVFILTFICFCDLLFYTNKDISRIISGSHHGNLGLVLNI